MFFYLIKNNQKKKKKEKKKEKPKTETKHVHKQLKELNQGQVNNTHLSKSFLTHIARVFSIIGEKPREAECI